MDIKTRRESEKEDRKESIRKSAHDLFLKESYYKTTMNMIAESAGLGKATLYYYYKSKEDILINLFKCDLEKLLIEIKNKCSSGLNFFESYRVISLTLMEFSSSYLFLIHTIMREKKKLQRKCSASLLTELFTIIKHIPKLLSRYFTIKAKKEKLNIDVDLLFRMVMFQVMGSSHYGQIIKDDKKNRDEFTQSIEIIYNGMNFKKG